MRAAEQMGRLTNKSGNVDIERFQRFIDLAAKIGAATEGQVGHPSFSRWRNRVALR